jgi:hypothetical protein
LTPGYPIDVVCCNACRDGKRGTANLRTPQVSDAQTKAQSFANLGATFPERNIKRANQGFRRGK